MVLVCVFVEEGKAIKLCVGEEEYSTHSLIG